jgi:Amt family ammonium transporter
MMKERLGYDDALDAFGVHGVGGLLGALLTGVFAQKSLNEAGANGLLFGNPKQLVLQALACLAAAAYAVVLTLVILKVIDALVGLRVSRDDEREGLDINLHGEEGYVLNSYATLTGHRHDDEDEDDVPAPSTTGSPLTAENA